MSVELFSAMESPEAHPSSGDWSPRISFSFGFASKQRISSPANNPIHDSEFEFSSLMGVADLTPKWCMLSADELFSDGKLRLVEKSSDCGMIEGGWREDGISACGLNVVKEDGIPACRVNAVDIHGGNNTDNIHAFDETKLPTIRVGKVGVNGHVVVDNTTSLSRRFDGRDQADALRLLTNRGDLYSAACMQEKERLPTSKEDVGSARKRDAGENAGQCKLPKCKEDVVRLRRCENASREEVVSAQKIKMGARASKLRSPTIKEDLVPGCKLENGSKASKSRSPTSREDLIPACQLENGSKPSKSRSPTSREELMLACGRFDNTAEMEMGGGRIPTNRECLKSVGMAAGKCEETRTPVRWREESLSKKKKEDEHASQLKRFNRNPRSASMTMGGFSRLANRACVSLDNSTCPSPTRSLSLPATTPASPTAAGSFSIFSTSSLSSSGYRSRIRGFFKLKKPAPKDDGEPSPPSCRLPLTPSSFFPFFKSKEGSGIVADSTPALPQQAHEQVPSSTPPTHVSYNGANCKEQRSIATSQAQVSPLHKDISLKPTHIAKPSQEHCASRADALTSSLLDKMPADSAVGSKNRIRHSYSLPHEKLVLGKDGKVVLSVDEPFRNEGKGYTKSNSLHTESFAKQSNHKMGTRANMGNSGGGLVRHHGKGLERPVPYTSSVRVTPVLNVPSCITPSLRKAKPSSKPKAFSFERLIFPRKGKAPVDVHTPP